MHRRSSRNPRPKIVDIDGRTTNDDDCEYMAMSDDISHECRANHRANCRSQIRVTDDLHGPAIRPRHVKSEFLAPVMKDATETAKPAMPYGSVKIPIQSPESQAYFHFDFDDVKTAKQTVDDIRVAKPARSVSLTHTKNDYKLSSLDVPSSSDVSYRRGYCNVRLAVSKNMRTAVPSRSEDAFSKPTCRPCTDSRKVSRAYEIKKKDSIDTIPTEKTAKSALAMTTVSNEISLGRGRRRHISVEKRSDSTKTAKPMKPLPIAALHKERESTSSSTARSPDEMFRQKLFRFNKEDKRPAKYKPVHEYRQKAKKMEQKTPDSDSIRTARDISTISPSEAKKYSFLNKKEDNTAYEISEISEFDLYATDKKQPQPDLKKLEAYFALPQPAKPKSKSKESTEAGKKSKTKTGGVQVRQLRTARKGGNTPDDKSKRKLLKKVKARAIKSARSVSRRELATSPKSSKKKSKESLIPVGKKISATNVLLHRFLRKKEVDVSQEKAEAMRKTSQRT